MFKRTGRNVRITPFRALVTDLMHFSSKVPSITAERRMKLAPLVAARQTWQARPSWCVMFVKAFGFVAAQRPELRQAYMTFPRPHLYEHPRNVATLNVTRFQGTEEIVVQPQIRDPELRTLAELDGIVRHYQEAPLEELRCYLRARRMSKVPRPLRRFLWWASLNVSGRRRTHNFGTFGITSTGAQGAGMIRIIPILTATLHYGMFDATGGLDMRLSYDHRVFDGATAARILVEMEDVLLNEILAELRGSIRIAAA